jgi:hypothetical protein
MMNSSSAPTNLYVPLTLPDGICATPLTQNRNIGDDPMLRRKWFACTITVLALFMVRIPPVRGQESKRPDLTGKWQLRTQNDKGREDISTLDLTESGSSLVGTITPLNGKALSISDGYYIGAAIKISASGRQGLISRWIEISGHVEGDKMLLNVKRGNGTTYPAIAERMPMNERK